MSIKKAVIYTHCLITLIGITGLYSFAAESEKKVESESVHNEHGEEKSENTQVDKKHDEHKPAKIGLHKHGFNGKKRYKGKGPLKLQTFCPVMGGATNEGVYSDYKGMRVYFCCDGCVKMFNRTPNMYIKTLKKYGEKPEKIVVE